MGNKAIFQTKKLKYIANVLDQFRKPITADKRNQNADILYDYYGASGVIDKIDGYTIDDHVMLIGEDGANLRLRNLPLMYEVNGKAWINNHAHILKPKDGTDFYFLFYALESIDINPYVTGSAQPKLNQDNLREIPVPFPPLAEQQKIADFLDEKSGEIDSIKADVQRQIELLNDYKKSVITEAVTKGLNPKVKLKDSGIEWIGKIPEQWRTIKTGYCFSFSSGDTLTSEDIEDEGDYIVYGANGIRGYYSFSNLSGKHILIGRVGALCGNVHIVDGKVWVTEHALIARKKRVLDELFFGYIFSAMNLGQYSKASAQPVISSETLASLKVPFPPLSEQKEIAGYLDEKCSEIDAVIDDKQKQLETLDEYKKSLIFEYVTGKKECV